MTTKRLYGAFVTYAALACLGSVTTSGDVRIVLWVFLAGLALKSYIAWAKQRIDP
jgi:hypothetical protein